MSTDPELEGTGDAPADTDEAPDPPPGDAAAGRTRGGIVRSVLAAVLAVLALVCLLATTVAVWAWATVFDGEKVASIVGDALAEPDVEAALADYVTTQVFTAVDVNAVVEDVLPDPLQRLRGPIVAGARTAVQGGLERAFSNPEVQDLLVRVVERAHSVAMRLLEGDGLADGFSVQDGEVKLNTLPLIGRGVTRVQELGLLTGVQMPELSADGDPADQIADLEAALGRDLPDDFGQLVVYQSDRLAQGEASLEVAQRTFALAKRAVWLLLAVTVLLLVLTIMVARNRWRATLLLGLGAAFVMVLARALVRRVVDEGPGLAARPGGRAAIDAILRGASSSLLRLAGVLLIVAVAAVVIALFRRHWQRADLVLVAAVVTSVVIVAILGFGIVSLVVALAAGLLVPVVAGRFA